jgi:hypothetical protein
MSKQVRSRTGAPVAASVDIRTKTPSIKAPTDAPDTAAIRQSQAPQVRSGASPKLIKAKEAATGKRDHEITSDPFAESERLRNEIAAEFGFPPSVDEKLAWVEHLDSLDARLLANLREDALIDTSVLGTFNAEAAKIPIRDDVFGVTREMMDAGIAALRQKLDHESELLKERLSIVQQMQGGLMAHSAGAFTVEFGPEDDPDFDLENV